MNFNIFFSIGRAGVPMEVMGLMLGEFVDDYTVRVIDVFAMPQSGTVSIYIFEFFRKKDRYQAWKFVRNDYYQPSVFMQV